MCCILSCFNCVWLFVTLWIVAHQTPLPMGFSRQGYQSGLSCPLLGNPSNPGIESTSLTSSALAGGFFPTRATWKGQHIGDLWPIIKINPTQVLFSGNHRRNILKPLSPSKLSHNSGGTTEAGREILGDVRPLTFLLQGSQKDSSFGNVVKFIF